MEGSAQGQGGKRRRLSALAWREVLKRFDACGVTVDEFCRDEGLSRSSFNRWRSRLHVRPGGALALAHRGGGEKLRSTSPSSPASPSPPPSPFVDLGLLGAPNAMTPSALTPPAALDLRLDLGGGIVLHLQRR